jgi:hypothetical protein
MSTKFKIGDKIEWKWSPEITARVVGVNTHTYSIQWKYTTEVHSREFMDINYRLYISVENIWQRVLNDE